MPGYKILSELGRGGMGVVYKARHLRLQRDVALKMILATAHAQRGTPRRFDLEARAVARLKHPHVVQLYEVGEFEGQPYFSLELVEGGSLADALGDQPMPPREAAALVETLARAVHAAHQRGIVHRDLKPANVLLTPDGQPKVTDFGLAKTAHDAAGPTPTNAILGTPAYMAPEQAEGQGERIGLHTDVYALGAILYETLCGCAPFSGPLQVVLYNVMKQPPQPPRKVRGGVPRNLETICLKCLEKEPWHATAVPRSWPTNCVAISRASRFRPGRWGWGDGWFAGHGGVRRWRRCMACYCWSLGHSSIILGLLGVLFHDVRLDPEDKGQGTKVPPAAEKVVDNGALDPEDKGQGTKVPPAAEKAVDNGAYVIVQAHNRTIRKGEDLTPDGGIFLRPTMRFGLLMAREKDPKNKDKNKKLTFDPWGRSNNTCLHIDGEEILFGDARGTWVTQDRPLPQAKEIKTPLGSFESVWQFRDVEVTQHVEVVRGGQSQRLDTCLVQYTLADKRQSGPTRQVGFRFLLDTFIGANDGVPFTIPGRGRLCDTMQAFDTPPAVPDFIEALEKDDLKDPGTVAHLQFRLGKRLEAPTRVFLGGWPNGALRRRFGYRAPSASRPCGTSRRSRCANCTTATSGPSRTRP